MRKMMGVQIDLSSVGSSGARADARFLWTSELASPQSRTSKTPHFFAVGTIPPTSKNASTSPSSALSRPLPSDSASNIQPSIPR